MPTCRQRYPVAEFLTREIWLIYPMRRVRFNCFSGSSIYFNFTLLGGIKASDSGSAFSGIEVPPLCMVQSPVVVWMTKTITKLIIDNYVSWNIAKRCRINLTSCFKNHPSTLEIVIANVWIGFHELIPEIFQKLQHVFK